MRDVHQRLERISALSGAGFYIALHVGFSFPQDEINRLPLHWMEYYVRHGFLGGDPILRWVYTGGKRARWSEIDVSDPAGVMKAAFEHGLRFGCTIVLQGEGGRRSYGSFIRGDREHTDAEIDELEAILHEMADEASGPTPLTPAEVEALRMQSEGMRLKQIAWELGISVSAVKARLANAKRKLGAQTASQAAMMAATKRIF